MFVALQSPPHLSVSLGAARFSPASSRKAGPFRRTVTMATDAKVAPAVIIGGGRVGSALEKMGDGEDVVVRRGQPIPVKDYTSASGKVEHSPIIVSTRNDSLDGIVDATPADRRNDLVFLQNGMLEPWLKKRNLEDVTQVLIYFAVAKLGEMPTDGKTDLNPEGLTAACGRHAEAFAARLHRAGLACKVLEPKEFQVSMLEKLIWISAFMLVGARHPGATVGQVESAHTEEVCSLIRELAAGTSAQTGAAFGPKLEERLCAYARSVAHFPTAVKEFEWRNGWFYSLSEAVLAQGKPDPFPVHTQWLKEVKAIQ